MTLRDELLFWGVWILIPLLWEIGAGCLSGLFLIISRLLSKKKPKLDFHPTISILIPVYNSSATIGACLESIAKQNYDLTKIEIRLLNNQQKRDASVSYTHLNEAYILNNFIDVNYNFNTHYLTNLSEELGTVTVDDQEVTFYGKKDENLYFIGLNFFYHLYSERDIQGLELVGQLIGMEPEKTPSRDIVKVTTRITGNRIEINAEPGTLMPMAMLDSFDSKQSIDEMNNLSLLVEGNTNIEVIYPHVKMGGLISLTGLVIFIVCLFIKEHLEALILKLISTFKEVVIEAKHEKFA